MRQLDLLQLALALPCGSRCATTGFRARRRRTRHGWSATGHRLAARHAHSSRAAHPSGVCAWPWLDDVDAPLLGVLEPLGLQQDIERPFAGHSIQLQRHIGGVHTVREGVVERGVFEDQGDRVTQIGIDEIERDLLLCRILLRLHGQGGQTGSQPQAQENRASPPAPRSAESPSTTHRSHLFLSRAGSPPTAAIRLPSVSLVPHGRNR